MFGLVHWFSPRSKKVTPILKTPPPGLHNVDLGNFETRRIRSPRPDRTITSDPIPINVFQQLQS